MCQIDKKTTNCQRRCLWISLIDDWSLHKKSKSSKKEDFDRNVTTCIECQRTRERASLRFFLRLFLPFVRFNNNYMPQTKWHCLIIGSGCCCYSCFDSSRNPRGYNTQKKFFFSLSLSLSPLLLSASSVCVLANVTIKDNGATLYSCHSQSFKYFACWYSNVVLTVVVVVIAIGGERARAEKKWRMTIGDVSRSSNKCVRMRWVLSMRKYHDLSCTWSLESSSVPLIFITVLFSLSALTWQSKRNSTYFKFSNWSCECFSSFLFIF